MCIRDRVSTQSTGKPADRSHGKQSAVCAMISPITTDTVIADIEKEDEANILEKSAFVLQVQDECSMSFVNIGRRHPTSHMGNLASAVNGLRLDLASCHGKISFLEFSFVLQAAGAPMAKCPDPERNPDKWLFDLFIDSDQDQTCSLRDLFASIAFLCDGSLEDKLEFCWELFAEGGDRLDLHLVSDLMHCVLWPSLPVIKFPELSTHRSVGRPGLGAVQRMDLSRRGVAELANDMSFLSSSTQIKKDDFCEYFRKEPFLLAWYESMQRRVQWHRWQRQQGAKHVQLALS
eukprot:TRINITY_DN50172_c0_g1_i1.p1 TRINITY_DN50172_c0_g1~~TRINITY_DN50172_c0_g1_i1.p1  ORF type:complete len:290 (+),score=78.05 TRINITY_DN50172_c0_g1_i1:145-1014(+)